MKTMARHLVPRLVSLVVLLGTPLWAQEPAPQYFTEAATWSFSWGTDTAFTLSNLEAGSTNATSDGTTSFDGLWTRLYGKLAYGAKAELVTDVFSSQGREPSLYGLYARVEPSQYLSVRVGLLPLVVGGWQDRAYPSRQPLVNQPLLSQYLLTLRSDSVPSGPDEVLAQRGRGALTRYAATGSRKGSGVALTYERCWNTGIEVFGRSGGFRYRVAVMEGPPGVGVPRTLGTHGPKTLEGRVTYRFGQGLRIGASWARGSYLDEGVTPLLPAGKDRGDYRQELLGADVALEKGRLEAHGEWMLSRYDAPNVNQKLSAHGFYGEASVGLAPGLRLAARYSALLFSDLTSPRGRRMSWDADAERLEGGLVYRFWGDRVAVKAVAQRTEVDTTPRRREDIAALQLSLHH